MSVEVANYRPAKLVPLTSPQQVREATVRDYKRNAERAGQSPPVEVLEKLAIADCEMADAYMRGLDLSPPRKKKPAAEKPSRIIQPKDDIDTQLKAAPAQRDRPMTYLDFLAISTRWPYAMGRMKRILEGSQPNRDPIKVAESCEIPDLAVKVLRLQRNWLMRNRDSRHNPFRGLNQRDALRLYVRAVEDICDQSTRRLGPWLVK